MTNEISNDTIDIYFQELKEFIEFFVFNKQIRDELINYLYIDFYIKNILSLNNIQSRTIAWVIVVTYLRDSKIKDLDWSLICKFHNINLFKDIKDYSKYPEYKKINQSIMHSMTYLKKSNTRIGWIHSYDILKKFYLFLYNSGKYNFLRNIEEIKKYEHLLINIKKVSSSRFSINQELNELHKVIFSDFPIRSKYENMIQMEYELKGNKKNKVNYNINTQSKFIKEILVNFLLSFERSKELITKRVKTFVYYFNESLNSIIINKYEDFNMQIFNIQYEFYSECGKFLESRGVRERERMQKGMLVAFYRHLIYKAKMSKGINLFSCEFRQAIYSKNFYKYFEKNYAFVYHNSFERPPKEDRFCILPEIQTLNNTNAKNNINIGVDLYPIDLKYRDDIKQFIWYSKGSITSTIKYLNKLIEFLNLKNSYDKVNKNVRKIATNEIKEFSKDFLWEYRNTIELQSNSGNETKNIFKVIRKYLKYYSKKYNVSNSDLDILSLKGLETFNGGKPITQKDSILIYREFEKNENEKSNGRLYTIVFELFMLTNLRIGEILNLRRDLNDNNTDILEYLSKTSNNEFIKQKVTNTVSSLIAEAISLTKDLVIDDDLMSRYIFIESYKARHIYKNKRLAFYAYFKEILANINNKLEIKDYTPYNVRHTFINHVYKEGIKNDLSLSEMAIITGNSYKTANLYYRKYNEIDLYVEAMAQVTITDVDIYGNIVDVEVSQPRRIVKKGLGQCSLQSCKFNMFECLMCKHFITFTNRIPYFEQMIENYNQKIAQSSNSLEVRELNMEKKLLGRYLSEMYKIQKMKGEN